MISIIALLIALLLPALSSARRAARGITCAGNERQIGISAAIFATDNDGRGPGAGHRSSPSSASIAWDKILNTTTFENDQFLQSPIQVRTDIVGEDALPKRLACTEMSRNIKAFARAYRWSLDAAGGPNHSTAKPRFPYGEVIADGTTYNLGGVTYDEYALGARLEAFDRPSFQFLMVEGERNSDYLRADNATPTVPQLGIDSNYAAFSSDGGTLSYRHGLSGNFLFIDGHVEASPATEPVLDRERSHLEP